MLKNVHLILINMSINVHYVQIYIHVQMYIASIFHDC